MIAAKGYFYPSAIIVFAHGILQKAKHRGKEGAIEAVAAKYNVSKKSVAELLHEQHMSDEVSGPEDANDTSKAVWTTRMAFKTGLGDVSAEALKKKRFVEVLECPWRSDEVRMSSTMVSII